MADAGRRPRPRLTCVLWPAPACSRGRRQAGQGQQCTHRVSISPVSQCHAARVSLYSEQTRLEASVERSSVWKSSVALRCASRDSASWPSTTWQEG